MSSQASESHEGDRFRIEVVPEKPPVFTIRATLLDGRYVLAESVQTYADLAGAVKGLTELGSSVAAMVTHDFLASVTPHGDDDENEPPAAEAL